MKRPMSTYELYMTALVVFLAMLVTGLLINWGSR